MMYLSNILVTSLILVTTTIHSSLCVYPPSHYALHDISNPHYHPDILLGQFYPPPPNILSSPEEEEEEEEATYPPTYPPHLYQYLSHPFYSLYNSPPPPPPPPTGPGASTTTSKPFRYLYPYTSYPHQNPTTSSIDSSTPQSYHPYNLPSSTESATNSGSGNGTRKTVLAISSIIIPIQQSSNGNGNGKGRDSNLESPGPAHNNVASSSRSRGRGNDRNSENNNGENTNNREPSPFYIIVAQHNSDSDSDNNGSDQNQNQNQNRNQNQDQDQRAPGQQHYQHQRLPVAEPTRRSNENRQSRPQPNGSNNGQTRNFALTKYVLTRSNEPDEPENDTPQENTQDFYPPLSHYHSDRTQPRQNSGSGSTNSSTANKRRQFHSISFKHLPRYTATTGTGTSTTTTTTTPTPYYHYPQRYYPGPGPVPVPVPSPYHDGYEHPVGLPLLPPPTPQHLEPSTHYHDIHHHTLDEPKPKGYYFSYAVQSPETNDFKSAEETREGEHVRGSYSLLQPDGIVRTVRYYADPYNGFNALVENSPAHHHPNQIDPSSSHPPKYNPSSSS